MITEVITREGRKISAEEAVRERDLAIGKGETPSFYMDPETGETVLKPRRGSVTPLTDRQAHFYHPADVNEAGLGNEKGAAVEKLEEMLRESGEFPEMRRGLLQVHDREIGTVHGSMHADFDYGLHVLWAKNLDGDEYALLVVNRTPNSKDYLNLVKGLGNRERFGNGLKIGKRIVNPRTGEAFDIGNDVHLATIQLMNEHMYRQNEEPNHPEGFLMLGDWQSYHLSNIYRPSENKAAGKPGDVPEFAYFDPATGTMHTVNMHQEPHDCQYSDIRYSHKGKAVPAGGSEFCRHAEITDRMKSFTLEPFEIRKDALRAEIGSHPRLYLARVAPIRQTSLFSGF
jgi:hypothetical protein